MSGTRYNDLVVHVPKRSAELMQYVDGRLKEAKQLIQNKCLSKLSMEINEEVSGELMESFDFVLIDTKQRRSNKISLQGNFRLVCVLCWLQWNLTKK